MLKKYILIATLMIQQQLIEFSTLLPTDLVKIIQEYVEFDWEKMVSIPHMYHLSWRQSRAIAKLRIPKSFSNNPAPLVEFLLEKLEKNLNEETLPRKIIEKLRENIVPFLSGERVVKARLLSIYLPGGGMDFGMDLRPIDLEKCKCCADYHISPLSV